MLFVSNAPNVLTKKVAIAQQRMFLFAENIEPPDDKDDLSSMLAKINGSRGFCAKVNEDQSMSCVRSAGWKANRIYYNYAPSAKTAATGTDTGNSSMSLSVFDVFARYYSIGRSGNLGYYYTSQGSILETVDHEAMTAPAKNVMVLPPCDGTPISSLSIGLAHSPSSSISYGYTNSGNYTTSLGIVTGRWRDTISTACSFICVKGLDLDAGTATLSKAFQGVASTTYPIDKQTNGPQVMTWSTQTYHLVLNPYSDTVQSQSTYYSDGPYQQTTNITDSNILYGQASSHANTGEYALTWGMMPIVGQTPTQPMYAVVLRSGNDFEQTGLTEPGTKPVMQMKNMGAFTMPSRVIM